MDRETAVKTLSGHISYELMRPAFQNERLILMDILLFAEAILKAGLYTSLILTVPAGLAVCWWYECKRPEGPKIIPFRVYRRRRGDRKVA